LHHKEHRRWSCCTRMN